LMKGKIVALELLKILLENAGAVFRTSERYVSLSLLTRLFYILMLHFCSFSISSVNPYMNYCWLDKHNV
jgi:brefeldin A-inhibited guanine nucleotide-exchange protein